jgi:G3E family GTPase
VELAPAGERSLGSRAHLNHHHHHDTGEHHDHSEHHFSSLELPLPDRVAKNAFSEFLRDLPEEIIRAKGLVRFIEDPGEFFVFQKVDRFEEPQFFPIGKAPRINKPLALFIGPDLPEERLRTSIAGLVSSAL